MTKTTKSAKATGAKTNNKANSLIKVVVSDDRGKWISPEKGEKFYIDEDAKFPEIVFAIDTEYSGPFQWSWTISWPAAVSGLYESRKRGKVLKTFSVNGISVGAEKTWNANLLGLSIGGTLSVTVKAGADIFKRSVTILGKNPAKEKILAFLSTLDNIKGMEVLLRQESKFKHFIDVDNQPIVSFDAGYGVTQMTNPAPSYQQVWDWKENIKVGAALYRLKQREAEAHLSQGKRTYTEEQLKLETWARWNGGVYHVWDTNNKRWARNPKWLCDSATGNIGWDMNDAENRGKGEAELHKRDSGEYPKPPKRTDRDWDYSGVCYADHLSH